MWKKLSEILCILYKNEPGLYNSLVQFDCPEQFKYLCINDFLKAHKHPKDPVGTNFSQRMAEIDSFKTNDAQPVW